ncbi:STAS domain-containing protein [Streptomyces capparidis]
MSDELHLSVGHTRGSLAVAAVAGDVTLHTAPALRSRALELIEEGRAHLVLDLGGVEFCDSAGLSALIGVWHAARNAGGSLVLAAVPQRLSRMLALTGVDTLLPVHPTASQALAAHGGPGDAGDG